MFEWIFVAGMGANVKRDWAKPRISPFRRQFCSSFTRHWHEFFKIFALQYQGTMRPHACASWLECPNYAAPVESAKGGRVGDRVPYVTLINQHLVIARLLHSLMAPVRAQVFLKYQLGFSIHAFTEGSNQLLSVNPQMASIVDSRLPGQDQRSPHLRSSRSPAHNN